MNKRILFFIGGIGICVVLLGIFIYVGTFSGKYTVATTATGEKVSDESTTTPPAPIIRPLDIAAYNAKLEAIANNPPPKVVTRIFTASSGVTSTVTSTITAPSLWPVKTVLPDAGALLPFNRIVAYYGNFYSTQMGVLGEYPPDQMIQMLQGVVAQWQAADPSTPVIPALDYIAVTAQGSPGPDGKYRLRMPASQINEALSLIAPLNGLVFLDVQVGWSNVETEVPLLAPYLKMPNVELSLDPEFALAGTGKRPGTKIGTLDASDINFAANYLANIVTENNLPPKILVVHRFTQAMVTHYQNITPLPQVQIVMDMDGWGPQQNKLTTYQDFIASEPVQFTGFKLFYKNDVRTPSSTLLTPAQLLRLRPEPSYIQYQ